MAAEHLPRRRIPGPDDRRAFCSETESRKVDKSYSIATSAPEIWRENCLKPRHIYREIALADFTPILCIVTGLCWAHVVATWSPGVSSSRASLARATVACSLFLTLISLIVAKTDLATGVIAIVISTAVACLVGRLRSSTAALSAASAPFAAYLAGATR
ncbi:hypothetical protein M2360_001579 [Rhizobium sp. SG_E_25_P2]|uniref:hypothetical protein n=1 Tax=Rhizobium sp. SG_E_25_P2 TaxID=2879942 RepID=UPI0024741853|nr:hypothetical protein [Rhizobium sp. SG_E_25_P2]MDH6266183.1 hypothetical protein [Rhizobium sp. SG_E_25_P2]